MSNELSILALYGLMVLITITVQVLIAVPKVGLPYLASPRDEDRDFGAHAERAERTVRNSITAMALFAPAILILAVREEFTATTLLCAQVFLIARVLYVPIYILGIPWLRTLVFTLGFLATFVLYWLAL